MRFFDIKNKVLKQLPIIVAALLCILMGYHKLPKNTEKLEELAAKDAIIQNLNNKLACLTRGVLPTGGFCLDPFRVFQGGNAQWDGKVCAGIEKIIGHSSVGDFGAGIGNYGSCLLRFGRSIILTKNKKEEERLTKMYKVEMEKARLLNTSQVIRSWEGFDAAFNVEDLSHGLIHTLDLSLEVNLDRRFDWVVSFEVGEHIARDKEDIFIGNLIRHACKGIILSWAVQGQGGYHHVNNRNNDYIIAKMQGHGMVYDEAVSKSLKEEAQLSYFKNTLMVFRLPQKKC